MYCLDKILGAISKCYLLLINVSFFVFILKWYSIFFASLILSLMILVLSLQFDAIICRNFTSVFIFRYREVVSFLFISPIQSLRVFANYWFEISILIIWSFRRLTVRSSRNVLSMNNTKWIKNKSCVTTKCIRGRNHLQ